MNINKRIIILCCFSPILQSNADCQNLPIGTLPMDYNSSFAGSVEQSRIVTNINYLGDFSDLEPSKKGYYASYDNFFNRLGMGLGITAYYFDSFYGYNLTSTSLAFAPKLSIKGKYTISPSLDIGYKSGNIDYEDDLLQNGSENIRESGFIGRTSILFNSTHYYVGFSIRLFKSEELSLVNNLDDQFTSTLQMGYAFQQNENSKLSFTPQLVFPLGHQYGRYKHLVQSPAINLGLRYSNFLFSLISKVNRPIPNGFQLGWQNKNTRIIMTNQLMKDSNSVINSSYTGNLAFRYIVKESDKHRFRGF